MSDPCNSLSQPEEEKVGISGGGGGGGPGNGADIMAELVTGELAGLEGILCALLSPSALLIPLTSLPLNNLSSFFSSLYAYSTDINELHYRVRAFCMASNSLISLIIHLALLGCALCREAVKSIPHSTMVATVQLANLTGTVFSRVI